MQTVNRAENERRRHLVGLCYNCPMPVVPGKTRCEKHLAKNLAATQRYEVRRQHAGKCVVPKCENPPALGRKRCLACLARWAAYHRKFKYNLPPEAFAALMESQGNLCAICRRSTDRFHVDHNHQTMEIRGLLCGPCNKALGGFQDNVAILLAAIAYLAKTRRRPV